MLEVGFAVVVLEVGFAVVVAVVVLEVGLAVVVVLEVTLAFVVCSIDAESIDTDSSEISSLEETSKDFNSFVISSGELKSVGSEAGVSGSEERGGISCGRMGGGGGGVVGGGGGVVGGGGAVVGGGRMQYTVTLTAANSASVPVRCTRAERTSLMDTSGGASASHTCMSTPVTWASAHGGGICTATHTRDLCRTASDALTCRCI